MKEREYEGTKERWGDGEIKRKGEKEKRIIRRGDGEKMRKGENGKGNKR